VHLRRKKSKANELCHRSWGNTVRSLSWGTGSSFPSQHCPTIPSLHNDINARKHDKGASSIGFRLDNIETKEIRGGSTTRTRFPFHRCCGVSNPLTSTSTMTVDFHNLAPEEESPEESPLLLCCCASNRGPIGSAAPGGSGPRTESIAAKN
jgi:hypothetical protein